MRYSVVFTPEAEEQLAGLYRYIALKASPEVAEKYTSVVLHSVWNLSGYWRG